MRFKKVFSNLELEGQGRGIIIGVTRLLLLGPFYTIQTNFMYFFAHDCMELFDTEFIKLMQFHKLCGPIVHRLTTTELNVLHSGQKCSIRFGLYGVKWP